MIRADTLLGRLTLALAGRPATTTTSTPIRTTTRWAAALGARPITTIAASVGESDRTPNRAAMPDPSGDHSGAVAALHQALVLFREIGDRSGEAHTLAELGILRQDTGDYAQASVHLEHALGLFREIGDRIGEARALSGLGRVRYHLAAGQSSDRDLADRVRDAWGGLPRPAGEQEDPLADRVAVIVARLLGTVPDQLKIDADGDIGIRAGSAMVFVRVRDDPPLVDVFSPVLTEVEASVQLYAKLSMLTNRMPIGRLYYSDNTIWASVPVFARNFQQTHLMLAIQVMVGLADELDDRLSHEFGGRRFFEDDENSNANWQSDIPTASS